MKLTPDQITKIKEYASKFLPISDIALLLEVPAWELKTEIMCDTTEASVAYRKGKAEAKLELHSQEFELAKIGSPQALENINSMLLDMEDEEA